MDSTDTWIYKMLCQCFRRAVSVAVTKRRKNTNREERQVVKVGLAGKWPGI